MATRKQPTSPTGDPHQTSPSGEADSVYYSRWFNEDALINQRLTWLLLAQGLLFAAYGTVATKAVDSCDDKADYLFSVLGLISTIGPIFAAVILVGIGAAISAQGVLHYKRKHSWRGIGVSTPTTGIGWLTGLAVPLVFFIAWQHIPRPDVQKVIAACKIAAASASAASVAAPAPHLASSPASAAKP